MNQDEVGMKRFIFEIYDTLGTDRLNEESLFKFMAVMSSRVPGVSTNPVDLMNLHEHESDMFLDLFSNDFCKI